MLEALSWAVHKLQDVGEEQLESPFCLSCDLPQEITDEISGAAGQAVMELQRETETRIRIEDIEGDEEHRQCLTIEGPLLSTFIAHRIIMKRYHDIAGTLDAQLGETAAVNHGPVSGMGAGVVSPKGKAVKGLVKGKGN